MSDSKQTPTLADFIAATPGAQTRDKALAHMKARRQRLLKSSGPAPSSDQSFDAPEPIPVIETPDHYAAEFWQRFADKRDAAKTPPPRGRKPRLVIDNDEPPTRPTKR